VRTRHSLPFSVLLLLSRNAEHTGWSQIDSFHSEERFISLDDELPQLLPTVVDEHASVQDSAPESPEPSLDQHPVRKKYTPRKPRRKLYIPEVSEPDLSPRVNRQQVIVGNNRVGKVGKLRCGLCRKRNSKVQCPLPN
jgi:hypothetical protein